MASQIIQDITDEEWARQWAEYDQQQAQQATQHKVMQGLKEAIIKAGGDASQEPSIRAREINNTNPFGQ